MPDVCSVCKKKGGKSCSKCRLVSYCSSECQKIDWAQHKERCQPIIVTENSSLGGRGILASRDIKVGELILKDKAVIILPHDSDIWGAGEQIVKQVVKLNNDQREQFYRLTTKDGLKEVSDNFILAAGTDKEKIEQANRVSKTIRETSIFFNNDIGLDDGNKGLFLRLALTNHSCHPSSCWSTATDGGVRTLELKAIHDIKKGDEITVNYMMVDARFSSRQERQDKMREGWGFDCQCMLCQGGSEDSERKKVCDLQSQMRSECDKSLDLINWDRLCELQSQLVIQVEEGLCCAPQLLLREYQSLVHLAQLARRDQLVVQIVEKWSQLVERLKISKAIKELQEVKKKLEEWSANLKKSESPHEIEVTKFLWLM